MKNLTNLNNVKTLNKEEQKAINGGDWYDLPCTLPNGSRCPVKCFMGNCLL